MEFESRALLLDELSQKLLAQKQTAQWEELFRRGAHATLHVEDRYACMMQAESAVLASLSAGEQREIRADLQRIVEQAGGKLDPCLPSSLLAVFPDVASAMRMALSLQRNAVDLALRIAVVQGVCTFATFTACKTRWSTPIGLQPWRVAQLVETAPVGTIVLAPDVYPDAERVSGLGLSRCLLTQEFHGHELAQVNLTLPPPVGSGTLSTFAGLGLTPA